MKRRNVNPPSPQTAFLSESQINDRRFLDGCERMTLELLLLLTFLLPLKFGQLAMMGESPSFFPLGGMSDWLWITWPSSLFGCVSGAALALSVAMFGVRRKPSAGFLCWLALLPLSALGMVNASTADGPMLLFNHLFGIVACIGAMMLAIQARPESAKWFVGTASASALLVVCSGIYQYFWGFDEQLAYFEQYGAPDSMTVSQSFVEKLHERRVFGPFAGCNTLAGYLLLTGAVMTAALYHFGKRFSPPRLSGGICASLGGAALLFVLTETGSRSALVVLAAALAILAVVLLRSAKMRWIALFAGILLTVAATVALLYFSSRGGGSAAERLLYWKSSFRMIAEHPFCGSGWGDFHFDHMLYKGAAENSEAARWPHNIVLCFGGQSGMFAMLALLGAVLWPILGAARRIMKGERRLEYLGLFVGCVAFFGHSLLDVNFQIPGAMATFGLFLLLLSAPDEVGEGNRRMRIAGNLLLGALAVATLGLSWYGVVCESWLDRLQSASRGKAPDPYKVRQAYEKLEQLRPRSHVQELEMGDWLLRQNLPTAAEEHYKVALNRAPERPATWFRLYLCRRMTGDRGGAEACLREAIRRYPAGKEYRLELERFLNGDHSSRDLN